MKAPSSLLILIAMLLANFGCGSGDTGKDEGFQGLGDGGKTPIRTKRLTPKADVNCRKGTGLTYENFGAGFLSTYCVGCHSRELSGDERYGAPENIDFDHSQDAKIWRNRIIAAITGPRPLMPPNAFLDSEDQQLALIWLKCGSPGP